MNFTALPADPSKEFVFGWIHLCEERYHICTKSQTVWECLSPTCKNANIFFVIVLIILGVIITVANLTVIAVYSQQLKRRTSNGYQGIMSQIYYKLSLAFADLLMGAIVCALSVVNFGISFFSLKTWDRLEETGMVNLISDIDFGNKSMNSMLKGHDLYVGTMNISAKHGSVYFVFLVVAGGLAFASWTVSIYTLLVCSADRLYAVWKLKHCSTSTSLITIGIIWVGSLFIAAMPFMSDIMEYGGWTIIYFTSTHYSGQLIIMFGLVFPLLGMWVLNFITYGILKRRLSVLPHQVQYRRQINSEDFDTTNQSSIADTDGILKADEPRASVNFQELDFEPDIYITRTLHQSEFYFTITLVIIVAGFTFSFLPMIIAIAVSASIGSNRSPASENYIFWFTLICISNSFWNCIIYNARNKDFRFEVKKIYSLMLDHVKQKFIGRQQ